MKGYLFIAGTIFCNVLGQMVLKFGENTFYFPKKFTFQEVGKSMVHNFTNWHIILFLFISLIAVCFWVLVIQRFTLSVAYPFLSLNFVLVALLSWWLFNEHLSIPAIIGIVFIVAGTIFLGLR